RPPPPRPPAFSPPPLRPHRCAPPPPPPRRAVPEGAARTLLPPEHPIPFRPCPSPLPPFARTASRARFWSGRDADAARGLVLPSIGRDLGVQLNPLHAAQQR
uniref:Uncharacterized protein n=1 Tax=Oryza punctata TaxID=4537 RepID=A0A0E0MPA7_ORYPU